MGTSLLSGWVIVLDLTCLDPSLVVPLGPWYPTTPRWIWASVSLTHLTLETGTAPPSLASQPSLFIQALGHKPFSFPRPVPQTGALEPTDRTPPESPWGHWPSAPFLACRGTAPNAGVGCLLSNILDTELSSALSKGSKFATASYSWLQPAHCC